MKLLLECRGRLAFLTLCLVYVCVHDLPAQPLTVIPKPRVMMLGVAAVKSSDLLKGPPETATMRSGYVVLAPKKSVGKHTTGSNEEALVVLAGSGEMRIAERDTLKLNAWCVAYCPPMAVHDVVNTGQDTLRYVWLVAKAQQ